MTRFKALFLCAAFAVCACAPTPRAAAADMVNSGRDNKHIQITSDGELDMRYGEGQAIFTKNVQVRDEIGLLLTCERLTVFFVDQTTINKLKAEDNVFIFHEDMTGHCGEVEYTVATEQAVMTIDPVIRKAQDTYAADIIRINRADGRVLFEPSARLVVFPQGQDPLAFAREEKKKTDDAETGAAARADGPAADKQEPEEPREQE